MKPIVSLAVGETRMSDLSTKQRRDVGVKLWSIRLIALLASFLGVVVPILHARA
jgi:hypothetical protein